MKKYKINELEYELINNYKDGFDYETVKEKATEYFNDFDYIVGDWSYGSLRLKGFYDSSNKKSKKYNNYYIATNGNEKIYYVLDENEVSLIVGGMGLQITSESSFIVPE